MKPQPVDRNLSGLRLALAPSESIASPLRSAMRSWCWLVAASCASSIANGGSLSEGGDRSNFFKDPFVQATKQIPTCPVPEGPLYTQAEAKAQSHIRVEKGTTCYLWGRCRLPNGYLYDKEIIPRVATYINRDERFASTSVWLLGQRRWVYLKGCVSTEAQRMEIESEVRLIDDVEAVVNELMVGTSGKPPYVLDRAAK